MASEDNQEHIRELMPGASLREVFDFSNGLTRERNHRYLPTFVHRVLHLSRGGGEAAKAISVGDENILPVVASKLLLRILGVLESLGEEDGFIDVLMHKYPESGCSYCGNKPCQCGVEKPATFVEPSPSKRQRSWSLSEWQQHMRDVYGAKNDMLDLSNIVLRLEAEIGEVAQASLKLGEAETSDAIEAHKKQILSELADSFAWLVALYNHKNIQADFEATFLERYGKGCPHCGAYPCQCESFTYIDERKDPRNKR